MWSHSFTKHSGIPSGALSWAWTSENEWVWARLSKLTTQGQAEEMIPNLIRAQEKDLLLPPVRMSI